MPGIFEVVAKSIIPSCGFAVASTSLSHMPRNQGATPAVN